MNIDNLLINADVSYKGESLKSKVFDDIYFSNSDAIGESTTHFLDINNIDSRIEDTLNHKYPKTLTVLEVGFGTGLNFFLTLERFKDLAKEKQNKGKTLYYISCEKHPIEKETLKKLYSQEKWQRFSPYTDELLDGMPPGFEGFHLISFSNPNVKLLLLYGDAEKSLKELTGKVDVVYLDGFAPKKSPDTWKESIFFQLKRLSKENTTISSFSCARVVKDGLEASGFICEKQKGFGNKREILKAFLKKGINHKGLTPAWANYQINESKIKTIAVIGAGISGACISRSLADEGIDVVLLDANDGFKAASAVPYASTHLHPACVANNKRYFDFAAYIFAIKKYNNFLKVPIKKSFWNPCGLIDLEEGVRKEKLLKNKNLSYFLKSTNYEKNEALYYRMSGSIHSPELLKELVDHKNIETIFNTDIKGIKKEGETWSFELNKGKEGYIKKEALLKEKNISHVVFATGHRTPEIFSDYKEYTKPMRGQLTGFKVCDETIPNTVVCKNNMLIKASDDEFYAGGTYDLGVNEATFKPNDDKINEENIINATPYLKDKIKAIPNSFVGVRLSSNDTLPLVGMLPIKEDFIEKYKYLQKNARKEIIEGGNYIKDIYVCFALGSKGMIHGFLNAEIISSLLLNRPLPIPFSVSEYINPARFLIRQIKRRQV